MKMTPTTTLAELQTYLEACGNPFVTMMKGIDGKKHVIMFAPDHGQYHGHGETVVEALEGAFTAFRLATLPEELLSYTSPNAHLTRREAFDLGVSLGGGTPYCCNVPMCGESGVCDACRARGAR